MARQAGPILLTGTIDGLTFYVLNGKHYVRAKSLLIRNHFRTKKSFERSRVRAGQFGEAARLASQVYRTLPRTERRHGLMGQLTAIAFKLLQGEDKTKEEVVEVLQHWLEQQRQVQEQQAPKPDLMLPVVPQQKTTKQPIGSKPIRKPMRLLSKWHIGHRGELFYPAKKIHKGCFNRQRNPDKYPCYSPAADG